MFRAGGIAHMGPVFRPILAVAAAVVLFPPLSACGPGPLGDSAAPLLVFGRSGMGPYEFNYPRAAVFGGNGRLYVVDKAGRVQAFSPDAAFVVHWRMPQTAAGKPTGLGVAPDGRVYVADTHYARVCVYDADGELLEQFGTFGDGPGQFRLPTDVAIGRDGRIYVSEYGGNDRVNIYSADHEFLTSFGGADAGEARLVRPQSLHFSADGTLWVADACNHRICRFDADGQLLGHFGTLGDGPGELRFPYCVGELSDGTLVVCEYGNNRVQRFSRDGRSLGVWGRAGRQPGELAYPWALAVGPKDRLYVIDSGNNRIQTIAGTSARVWSLPRSRD